MLVSASGGAMHNLGVVQVNFLKPMRPWAPVLGKLQRATIHEPRAVDIMAVEAIHRDLFHM